MERGNKEYVHTPSWNTEREQTEAGGEKDPLEWEDGVDRAEEVKKLLRTLPHFYFSKAQRLVAGGAKRTDTPRKYQRRKRTITESTTTKSFLDVPDGEIQQELIMKSVDRMMRLLKAVTVPAGKRVKNN